MTYLPTFEEIRTATLRKHFDAYTDPAAADLVNALSSYQKTFGTDWQDRVEMLIRAMWLHDSGQFPDEWLSD